MNVKIEKLVYGGEGLGHAEGHAVFVPFVLPEEVVAVRPVERKKKFVRAQLVEVLTRSAERAVPPCPHFTACGGCHYQHIAYEEQLRLKAEILRETLRRIGRVEWSGPISVHGSPPLGYRNRAQWKVRPVEGKPRPGYFRAGSTALCPVEQCPILSPRLEAALQALRNLAAAGRLPAGLREVEAFVDDADERLLLSASLTRIEPQAAPLPELLREAMQGVETLLLHESSTDRYELFGPGFLHYRVASTRYRVGHLSFFQVNRYLVEEMVRLVAEGAAGELAWDLFAGVGLFAVPLTAHFRRVVAVEANAAAARDLAENLSPASGAAQAVTRNAEDFLARATETPDLVVLDPPRAGVPPAALGRLIALAPSRITYLSCDPATLARDLAALLAGGYRITEVHSLDVFPQTFHIESAVRLTRPA